MCIECGEFKPLNMFPLHNPYNLNSHRNQCNICASTKMKITRKKYRQENKKELLRKDLIYLKNRMETDPLYKATTIARNVTRKAITNSGYSKNSHTYEILGCSYEEFHNHIDKQFTEGMNWNNYGEWVIDHIVPLSFALNNEECLELSNYQNLRPIWYKENEEKSDEITVKNDIYYKILEKRILFNSNDASEAMRTVL